MFSLSGNLPHECPLASVLRAVAAIGREVMIQTWETMQSDIFRTAGSSAGGKGQRIERIFRDMAMGNSHRNTVLRDWAFRKIARSRSVARARCGRLVMASYRP